MSNLSRVIVGCVCLAGLSSMAVSPLAAQPVAGQPVDRYEYDIKAGVLRTLSIFTTWPAAVAPSPKRPLTIGVLGKDPFFEGGVNQLDQMVAAERATGRQIVVKRFDSAKDYQNQPCHMLFVSDEPTDKSLERTLEARLTAVRKFTDGKPVLLVGQSTDFAQQGGSVNLLYDRGKNIVRLQLNPQAATRADLKFAPGLLRVGEVIRDKD